jgi:hypothetical protein
MLTTVKNRAGAALAPMFWPGTLLLILPGLPAAPARGDEIRFLPSSAQVVRVVDFAAIRQSKTFQEVRKRLSKDQQKVFDDIQGLLPIRGLPRDNLARLTVSEFFPKKGQPESLTLVGTVKPVTAADVKKVQLGFIGNLFTSVVGHKEIKIGKFTLYQERVRTGPLIGGGNKDRDGDVGVCLVEPKRFLIGSVPVLKKVLERNKRPALSANMRAGVREAGSAVWSTVVDFQGLPKSEREKFVQQLGKMPEARDVGDKLKFLALAVKLNEDGSLKGSLSLHCTSAAGAGAVRKLVEATLADLERKLAVGPRAPESQKKLAEEGRGLVKAVKLSVTGDRVTARLEVGPAALARTISAMIAAAPADKKVPKKE